MKNAMIAAALLVVLIGCSSPVKSDENQLLYPDYPTYEEVVRFHGHSCPGSMMGYRMGIAGVNAAKAAGIDPKGLYAIVENNFCGVDAVQIVTSCTFGKKRIIYHDYGKNVFTFYSPKDKKGFRVSLNLKEVPAGVSEDRKVFTKYLHEAPEEDILVVSQIDQAIEIPKSTRDSVVCDRCKEGVNKNRTREVNGKTVCIPCSN